MPELSDSPTDRYLELLKNCLTRDIFDEYEWIDATWWKATEALGEPDAVWSELNDKGWRIICPVSRSGNGQEFIPTSAETMVGRERLDNVQALVERVLADDIPGDLVETGIWRGGTVILMRALLAVHDDPARCVWGCDSFEGLPEPDTDRYPQDASMRIDDPGLASMVKGLAVSVDQVKANFAKYGLLDDRVRFVEGWFSESLPSAPIGPIALLRLDGDLYESTMDALVHLEPKVSPGGFVIVDDYGALEPCRAAVSDYRAEHGIDDPIETVDWTGVYWRKSAR